MLSFLSWALVLSTLLVLPFSLFYFFLSHGFYLISASQVPLVVKNPPANTGYILQVALVVKNPPANVGDRRRGFDPGWGRCPGGGNGNPFQYSCLENPMDRGAWQATVHGVAKSQTGLMRLST